MNAPVDAGLLLTDALVAVGRWLQSTGYAFTAKAAALTWEKAEALSDVQLEAAVYPPPGKKTRPETKLVGHTVTMPRSAVTCARDGA